MRTWLKVGISERIFYAAVQELESLGLIEVFRYDGPDNNIHSIGITNASIFAIDEKMSELNITPALLQSEVDEGKHRAPTFYAEILNSALRE